MNITKVSVSYIYLFIYIIFFVFSALLYLLIVHNFHIILLCVLINMRALLVYFYRYYFFINAQRWFIILYRYIMYLCTHTFPVSQSINYGMNFRKHVINSPWECLYIFMFMNKHTMNGGGIFIQLLFLSLFLFFIFYCWKFFE